MTVLQKDCGRRKPKQRQSKDRAQNGYSPVHPKLQPHPSNVQPFAVPAGAGHFDFGAPSIPREAAQPGALPPVCYPSTRFHGVRQAFCFSVSGKAKRSAPSTLTHPPRSGPAGGLAPLGKKRYTRASRRRILPGLRKDCLYAYQCDPQLHALFSGIYGRNSRPVG